jgi:hypothetical protein
MKTPNTITVRHWTLDNGGSYHQPGSTLTIVADDTESPDTSEGCIGAARAATLAAQAIEHDAKAAAAPAAEAAEPVAGEPGEQPPAE